MRSLDSSVAVAPDSRESSPDFTSAFLVTIASVNREGAPEVTFAPGGPLVVARLALPATPERLEAAVARGQQAVVVLEHGDPTRPIVVGFLEPPDALQASTPGPADAPPCVEADVDGKRVRVTARDEIVLECGSASITLRRNGRLVIRGTFVETRSEGTNRIKGGQVQIN